MVQLSTRYDTTLKKKVFILKGEEAYARTTDVLADVVSDFADCNTHLGSARVGLVIDVLREIGDGWVYIYDNDDLIFEPIPWNSAHMDTIIDSDWNDKGVYWNDGRLEIGSASDTDTGFRLAYDIEHNIIVKYSGNKQCLASSSDTIKFVMPTPELFKSTLTLTSGSSNRYDSGATVNDLSLLYQSTSSSNNKQVKVYVDGTLNTTVTLTTGTASTLNIGSLTDGVHTIRAIFDGDEYSTYAETTLDISVGYKVVLTEYPNIVIPNVDEQVSCKVLDYLDIPLTNATVSVVEYDDGSYTPIVDASEVSDTNGSVTFDVRDNPVSFTGKPSYIKVGSTVYTQIPYELLTITSLYTDTSPYRLNNNSTYITKGNTLRITGYCNDSNGKISKKNIPITLSYGNHTETTYTNDNGMYRFDYVSTGAGYVPMNVTVASITKSFLVEDLIQYWVSKKTNPQEMEYSTISAELTQLNNGYKLTPTDVTNAISFSNLEQYGKVELEFDVVSLNSGKLHVNYQSFDIVRGHVTVSMDFNNHWLEVFVDGDNVKSLSNQLSVLLFGTNGDYVIFNNLKLKKWVDSNE